MATATLRHWQSATRSRSLQAAVVFSAVVHLGLFVGTVTNWRPPKPKAIPISFEVNFAAPPSPQPDPESKAVTPPPPAPKPEPPKPEPKKEEPKPEPKKEEPKPEPKKEEPKKEPEKVAEKKPEPKPEPKKEPEKKPEPKKETPKKETPKKQPEKKLEEIVPADAPSVPSTLPRPEVVAQTPPPSSGVQQNQLPSILNAWGRNVQRKVEKFWAVPAGVQLTPDQREVHISFTVGRNGMLIGQPTVVKAANQALAQSGINAILAAQPLPPLPIEYAADKQDVVYVFSVDDQLQPAAQGGTG